MLTKFTLAESGLSAWVRDEHVVSVEETTNRERCVISLTNGERHTLRATPADVLFSLELARRTQLKKGRRRETA